MTARLISITSVVANFSSSSSIKLASQWTCLSSLSLSSMKCKTTCKATDLAQLVTMEPITTWMQVVTIPWQQTRWTALKCQPYSPTPAPPTISPKMWQISHLQECPLAARVLLPVPSNNSHLLCCLHNEPFSNSSNIIINTRASSSRQWREGSITSIRIWWRLTMLYQDLAPSRPSNRISLNLHLNSLLILVRSKSLIRDLKRPIDPERIISSVELTW